MLERLGELVHKRLNGQKRYPKVTGLVSIVAPLDKHGDLMVVGHGNLADGTFHTYMLAAPRRDLSRQHNERCGAFAEFKSAIRPEPDGRVRLPFDDYTSVIVRSYIIDDTPN